jgi:transposase
MNKRYACRNNKHIHGDMLLAATDYQLFARIREDEHMSRKSIINLDFDIFNYPLKGKYKKTLKIRKLENEGYEMYHNIIKKK